VAAVNACSNWSGSLRFTPARVLRADDEQQVVEAVREARRRGGSVRVVGSRHSSSGILAGEDTLLSLEGLSGVIAGDCERGEAWVHAGTGLETLGRELYAHDLALPNYGDVATQTIAGAIGTGTHGSGRRLGNLSTLLVGAVLVDGRGERREIDGGDLQALRAARLALGTLGIFLRLRLALVPEFTVQRREYGCSTQALLPHLESLVAGNRSFDFYWYPRSDEVKLRLVNPAGGGSDPRAFARALEDRRGYGHEVVPTHSGIPHKFDEMEYALPYARGVECFLAVRERMLARWRREVGWRVLYRTVAGDDTLLSPAHGGDVVTISLHHNAGLPFEAFFADIEPIFRDHDGRPHWAKQHGLRAAELEPLYPQWRTFAEQRARFDPDGVFLTPYLRALLGVEAR
jgi:FAD/FMN-containing dehydrogenase